MARSRVVSGGILLQGILHVVMKVDAVPDGDVLFSTGPYTDLGGDNDTPCHLDMPLRGCTLTLDGETIIRDGDVVLPEMKASTAAY